MKLLKPPCPATSLLRFCLAIVVIAFSFSAKAATFDEIVATSGQSRLGGAVLPAGPALPWVPLEQLVDDLAILPSGRLLTIVGQQALVEIEPDGNFVHIGLIDLLCVPGYTESLGALVANQAGRLFVLRYVFGSGPEMTFVSELDPATAATLQNVPIDEFVSMLAPGPGFLWTLGEGNRLRSLDPDTGELGAPGATMISSIEGVFDADTDSAGRIWFSAACGVCSPPHNHLASFDPVTGEIREEPAVFSLLPPPASGIAIRRRCAESSTVRCLQGGRFRAEVGFKDHAGTTGTARVAAGRSGDTGIFYFFDSANWELMVKVLDGCGQNGKFWVFASASTDVEYTLTITDTETGLQKTYQNPLGQIARTVADTDAFSCTP